MSNRALTNQQQPVTNFLINIFPHFNLTRNLPSYPWLGGGDVTSTTDVKVRRKTPRKLYELYRSGLCTPTMARNRVDMHSSSSVPTDRWPPWMIMWNRRVGKRLRICRSCCIGLMVITWWILQYMIQRFMPELASVLLYYALTRSKHAYMPRPLSPHNVVQSTQWFCRGTPP